MVPRDVYIYIYTTKTVRDRKIRSSPLNQCSIIATSICCFALLAANSCAAGQFVIIISLLRTGVPRDDVSNDIQTFSGLNDLRLLLLLTCKKRTQKAHSIRYVTNAKDALHTRRDGVQCYCLYDPTVHRPNISFCAQGGGGRVKIVTIPYVVLSCSHVHLSSMCGLSMFVQKS